MGRHRLTLAERIRGTRTALNSPKTPKHFRVALEKHLANLQGRLNKEEQTQRPGSGRKRAKGSGLLDWLHL